MNTQTTRRKLTPEFKAKVVIEALWWQPTQGHALSPRYASNDGEAWQQFYRTQRTIRAQSG